MPLFMINEHIKNDIKAENNVTADEHITDYGIWVMDFVDIKYIFFKL